MNDIAHPTTLAPALASPNLTPSKASFKALRDCKSLQEAFETREFFSRISEGLPKHIDASSMLRGFVQAASKSPLIYSCDYRQAIGAFLSLAYLGLVPNTPLQLAHMIPFKSKRWNRSTKRMEDCVDLNIIIGYPGYLELAHRSGVVQSVHCDVVLPGEHFRAEQGSNHVLEHRKEIDQDTTGLTPRAAYAFVKMRGDADQFEVMSWHEIVAIRNRSQAYRTALSAKDEAEAAGKRAPKAWTEAPWVKDEREMGRKTPFRKLAKWLPKTPELRAGVAFEDSQDHGRLNYGAVIEGEASPLDGIPYEDDAPPVDPTSAHGIRTQSDTADAQRQAEAQKAAEAAATKARLAAEHKAAADRAAQARTTPPADTKPASNAALAHDATPGATLASGATLATGFEAVLVDADGEPLDTLYDDAAAFARAFMALWHNAGPHAEALVQHNADAIDDAQDDPVAADILLGMQAGAETIEGRAEDATAVEQNVSPPITVVEPPSERGKTSWPGYVKALKAALAEREADRAFFDEGRFVAWVEAQRNVLEACPMAQRMLAVRAIHASANGRAELPVWVSDMLRPKKAAEPAGPANASAPPDAPGPDAPGPDAPGPDAPGPDAPGPDAPGDEPGSDEKWVSWCLTELGHISTRAGYDTFTALQSVKTVMARLRRESPALFARADKAFLSKHDELAARGEG